MLPLPLRGDLPSLPSKEKEEEDDKEEAAEEVEDVEDVEDVEEVLVKKAEDHAVAGEVAQRRNADVEAVEAEAEADTPTALSGGRKKRSGRFFPARGERTARE